MSASASISERRGGDWAVYAAVVLACVFLWWLSATRPTLMPVFGPWEFSPAIFISLALTLFWFLRGDAAMPAAERLPLWRRIAFLAGLALLYAVLQTRVEYWAQHMFFINRLQHVAMHHVGPVLIALGFSGATLARGMPGWIPRLAETRPVALLLAVLQQPVIAVVLFEGLFAFWLLPNVHFRAMIDPRIYALMNWSMVLDGILFWALVLDPRPTPAARIGYGFRAALAIGVMFPQIVLGALITFAGFDLYPYYDLCGRLFPSMSALADQEVGGIVIWIPPAMMSVIAMLLVLNAYRLNEKRKGIPHG
ncbi:MAG: cytochrome c oxidase assembly protein [Maritimibacter sp.]